MGFFKKVYHAVSLIPEGRVMTYADIAEALGKPKKHKMVNIAMKFCPSALPWHRAVKKEGRMATGQLQAMVLQKEGVGFTPEGRVDMEKYGFSPEEMAALLKEKK